MSVPAADVKVTDGLDALVVTPRLAGNSLAVGAALRHATDAARRTAAGFVIPAECVAAIGRVDGLDFRLTEEAAQFIRNRADLSERNERLRAVVAELRALSVDELRRAIRSAGAGEVLDAHQVLNVRALSHPDCYGLCLFDEQGAGKTVSVIYAWDELVETDAADFMLVVAPKSMVPEWARDIHRFRSDLYTTAIATGTRPQKLAALRQGTDVLVTNFETAISLEHELTAHLRSRDGRAILVVDESFFVKSRHARRTRALRRLREWCGRAWVLCGTPAPNSASDVVEQVSLADLGYAFGGLDIPDDRDAAHQVINDTLISRGIFLRSLKQDVLPDLPTRSFDILRIPLAPDQQRAYKAALKDLIIDLRRVTDQEFARNLGSYMARRAALLQICSNPTHIVPGYSEIPSKLDALDRLVSEYVVQHGEKVVIWSAYRASLDAISARFSELGLVRYDGSVPDVATRRAAVRSFQDDPGTWIFVGNPAAAGAGLTLHAARIAIYESLTNQAAHYLQSLDRVHRRGQGREVKYVVLLSSDTLEEQDFERLRAKQQAAHDLLGDNVSPVLTRESMLHDLLATTGRNCGASEE